MSSALTEIIPNVTFTIMTDDGPAAITSHDVFSGKSVVLFGLAGAYTPSCHYLHLPGILDEIDTFKSGGVDTIACTTVNDIFVLNAWAKELGALDKLLFLADGSGAFAKALDLVFDGRPLGLGVRSKRYSMWVLNGVIQNLNIEPDVTLAEVSSAKALVDIFDMWSKQGNPNRHH